MLGLDLVLLNALYIFLLYTFLSSSNYILLVINRNLFYQFRVSVTGFLGYYASQSVLSVTYCWYTYFFNRVTPKFHF